MNKFHILSRVEAKGNLVVTFCTYYNPMNISEIVSEHVIYQARRERIIDDKHSLHLIYRWHLSTLTYNQDNGYDFKSTPIVLYAPDIMDFLSQF